MVDFIQANPRCALWAAMGSGKTVSTLTALDSLALVEDVFPALVLAPLRVARTVWGPEVQKWPHLKHLRVSVITGSTKERAQALQRPADIYCMNYENLKWLLGALGGTWPFKTIIADEFTRLKSFRLRQGSMRARALAKFAHPTPRFIGLTGTPSPNGLKDLWGQLWFLDRGARLGHSYSAFSDRWFRTGYDGYSLVPLAHSEGEIHEKVKDLCLTVDGLPVDAPIHNIVKIELPPDARAIYDEMQAEMFVELAEDIAIGAANAAVRTNKCLQICNGGLYTDEAARVFTDLHNAKLDALESIVEEANGVPVLVAYNFKHDLARLKEAFPKGKHLDADPKTIERWNAGEIPLLFAHPACLHPETEVLTEHRGWVSLVDVEKQERVHDGVAFVNHAGCIFSGVRNVISRFGITMTPEHKLLINGEWVEAKNVRDGENATESIQFFYEGDEIYLSEMLPLRRGAGDGATEPVTRQQTRGQALQDVRPGYVPQHDQHSFLVDMERDEGAGAVVHLPELLEVRGSRKRTVQVLGRFQKLLQRHVEYIRAKFDDRANRQQSGVFEGKLPLGNERRATSEQNKQPGNHVQGRDYAPRRILPEVWGDKGRASTKAKQGHDRRRSGSRLREIDVSPPPQVSPVYDLVDCGPRHRFLIRNNFGEVFISHNSAGHGLNLAAGGNILAFFGLNWSLEEHMQIIERIGPMRQAQAGLKRPVFVHYIVAADTVDEMVLDRLGSKRSVQDILLAAMKRQKS